MGVKNINFSLPSTKTYQLLNGKFKKEPRDLDGLVPEPAWLMWSWDSGQQIPCFDVHCQVKHRLQAPTLAKSLTFHIGCPVVRMDRLPNFLRYGAWLTHALCAYRVPLSLLINLRIKPLSFMLYTFLVQNKKMRESWLFQSCCLIKDPPPPPPAP